MSIIDALFTSLIIRRDCPLKEKSEPYSTLICAPDLRYALKGVLDATSRFKPAPSGFTPLSDFPGLGPVRVLQSVSVLIFNGRTGHTSTTTIVLLLFTL